MDFASGQKEKDALLFGLPLGSIKYTDSGGKGLDVSVDFVTASGGICLPLLPSLWAG